MARSSQYRLRRHRPGHQHPKLHGQCWAKMLRTALSRRSSGMDALGSDLSDYAMAWPRAAARARHSGASPLPSSTVLGCVC